MLECFLLIQLLHLPLAKQIISAGVVTAGKLAPAESPVAEAQLDSDCVALGDSRNEAADRWDAFESATEAERALGDACTNDALAPLEP